MEHLQEILRVWADLHNKPSKSQNEKRIMDDLAALLGRRCGEPCLHKMRIVRAGGELEPKSVEPIRAVRFKNPEKAKQAFVEAFNSYEKDQKAVHVTGFIDTPVEQFTDREGELVSFVDSQEEKKSPQLNIEPVSVAEVKRGRKAKVKE